MIKGAIFDVDGTILDSMSIWDEAGIRYLKSNGIEAPSDLGDTLFAMTITEAAYYLKEKFALKETTDAIEQGILDTVKDYYYEEAPLKSKVVRILEILKRENIPMAVASSSEKAHIEAAFQRLGILKYFQVIYTCKEVGEGKSSPLIFEKACEELGTDPGETYVFEDALHAIKTAKKAGFRTVGIYDRYSEKDQKEIQETADIYIESWEQSSKLWNILGNNVENESQNK